MCMDKQNVFLGCILNLGQSQRDALGQYPVRGMLVPEYKKLALNLGCTHIFEWD